MTRILGIDPGSRVTGYAVIDVRGPDLHTVCHGVFRPPASLPFHERIARIADALGQIIEQRRPREAAVEDLFHAANARSALRLAHVRGAILVEIARRGLDVHTYAPKSVKKALTGVGSADKAQVQAMVERLLNLRLPDASHDVSDALAVAICHAHTRRGDRA